MNIQIEIDADGDYCDACEYFDSSRDFCNIFNQCLDTEEGDDAKRCSECHEAEV